MTEIAFLNPENVSEEEVKNYSTRNAARAIVIDEEGKVALLHVKNKGYYKLPGGGLEGSEDKVAALRRECQEEIGCDIEVIAEVGSIVEYRRIFTLKQTSYCYLAKVKGKKGSPAFTDEEESQGFEQVWLSYDGVRQKMAESAPVDLEGSGYIVPRDTAFLEEAKNLLATL